MFPRWSELDDINWRFGGYLARWDDDSAHPMPLLVDFVERAVSLRSIVPLLGDDGQRRFVPSLARIENLAPSIAQRNTNSFLYLAEVRQLLGLLYRELCDTIAEHHAQDAYGLVHSYVRVPFTAFWRDITRCGQSLAISEEPSLAATTAMKPGWRLVGIPVNCLDCIGS
jgi:hypothetical protein